MAAVLAVLVAMLIHTLVFSTTEQPHTTGSRFGWDTIGQYLFSPHVLSGVLVTIELTIIAMLAGVILGIVLAVMRMSKSRLLSSVAWVYIWFFRGTPVFVQIIFWYNIAALYPHLTLGIPFGPSFVSLNINSLLTPFIAGSLALATNEGAYMSEIVRAGIISVDEGQAEAASSLGMSKAKTLRLIVLPQAMRLIIPPTGNETNANYRIIQLLIVASIWYLAMTTVLSIGQFYLERHYAKGSVRSLPATPMQRLRQDLTRLRPQGKPRAEVLIAAVDPLPTAAEPPGAPHD